MHGTSQISTFFTFSPGSVATLLQGVVGNYIRFAVNLIVFKTVQELCKSVNI